MKDEKKKFPMQINVLSCKFLFTLLSFEIKVSAKNHLEFSEPKQQM